MRIALAQIGSGSNPQENLTKITDFVQQSATEEADVVVFPEASMAAFGTKNLNSIATDHGENWRNTLTGLAQEHNITIVAGEFEPVGKRVRNLAGIYTPDGVRNAYTKIHLYDAFGFSESDTVEEGNDLLTVEIGGVTFGFALCYDIRFPKLFAELSRAGAQVIVVPTSWGNGEGKVEQWKVLGPARALDSNSFVIAVDQANPVVARTDADPAEPTGVGYSGAYDPFGHPLVILGEGEELRIVELDLDLVDKAKEAIPVLKNAKLGY